RDALVVLAHVAEPEGEALVEPAHRPMVELEAAGEPGEVLVVGERLVVVLGRLATGAARIRVQVALCALRRGEVRGPGHAAAAGFTAQVRTTARVADAAGGSERGRRLDVEVRPQAGAPLAVAPLCALVVVEVSRQVVTHVRGPAAQAQRVALHVAGAVERRAALLLGLGEV